MQTSSPSSPLRSCYPVICFSCYYMPLTKLKDLFFCQGFSKYEPQIDLSTGSKKLWSLKYHLELTNSCNVVKPSHHKLVNWVDFSYNKHNHKFLCLTPDVEVYVLPG